MTVIKAGDRFTTNEGCEVEVLEYHNAQNIKISFMGYGCTQTVRAAHLRNGGVKNPYFRSVCGIGFIGVGPAKVTDSGRTTRSYAAWHNMLVRCYAYKDSRPTYAGCYVEDEWHDYQKFSEWYRSQPLCEHPGVEVDKDILSSATVKMYGPDTCVLIPKRINSMLTDSCAARGSLPVGVSFHTQHRMYSANCSGKHLGYFDCPAKAHLAYKEHKESLVRNVAHEYRGIICERAYEALLKYNVVCSVYNAYQ